MKKNTLNEDIKVIKKIAARMPKTINEALEFEGDESMDFEPEEEEPVEEPVQSQPEDGSVKARQLIDNIRKMALRAMADLADVPQSPEYESLKRIWTLCDRSVNEKEEQREIVNKQNGIN